MTPACPGCESTSGPLTASAECVAASEVVVGREFSDPDYFVVHRLTVAAHRLQHPDDTSAHSVAVHLAALHGAVTLGLDPARNGRRIRRVSDGLRRGPLPPLVAPRHRGDRTITDVVAAVSAVEHRAVVRDWAAEVLAAWSADNDPSYFPA